MAKKSRSSAYKQAGVDIEAGVAVTSDIGRMAKSTFNRNVLTEIGSFGGLFRLEKSKWKDPVLTASTDGVGTKVMIAALAGRIAGTGEDLVNHCVNDILVQGAVPLFFLDYIAFPKFSKAVVTGLIAGLSKACRENGCVLLGGETAEMPGVYHEGHYDIAGTIVGVVERSAIVDGSKIRPGDVLIGLESSGLHTNGYSLARRALLTGRTPESNRKILTGKLSDGRTLADHLLAPHKAYLKPVMKLFSDKVPVTGLAHITGGGYGYNIVRILPKGVRAVVETSGWTPPEVFGLIAKKGNVSREEMYEVFNMGVGMVVFVRPTAVDRAMEILRKAGERPHLIGRVEAGTSGRPGSVKVV
jgi:phosphoribosylformylglycinamidine cyclo-ligase